VLLYAYTPFTSGTVFGGRSQRVSVTEKIASQKWYELFVEIRGKEIKGYFGVKERGK
jgi:hypothetical protein